MLCFQNVIASDIMGIGGKSSLEVFKAKILECMDMVSGMGPQDRIAVS